MQIWKVSINGGILVSIVGAVLTYIQQDYHIGIAGWALSALVFVTWDGKRGD